MSATLDAARRFLYTDEQLATHCARIVDGLTNLQRAIVLCHLAAPATPVGRLAQALETDTSAVLAAYRYCRENPRVRDLVESWFYPHRMRWAFAVSTVGEWRRAPDRPARLIARQPVLAETVEIHPTRGSCNYRCTMCLWSDQQTLTYQTKRLDTNGLMSASDWSRVLHELRDQGVQRLAISGGGEALINPELPDVLNIAADLGFEIDIYTTGYNIRRGTPLFNALLRAHRVRFSIHSPEPDTYDLVAGTRPAQRALTRVGDNLRALLSEQHPRPAVGIGFVIQPSNYQQISAMVQFAESLGADWLDLRKDEVDVTDDLTTEQLALVRTQLRAIRHRRQGRTRIDIGDELVCLANGQVPDRERTTECLARFFRPTIGAYGHLTPCDLKAEPRFSDTRFDLGSVKHTTVLDVVATSSGRCIPDACAQCMPSSRTGNAIVHKLLTDLQFGLTLDEQPFV